MEDYPIYSFSTEQVSDDPRKFESSWQSDLSHNEKILSLKIYERS